MIVTKEMSLTQKVFVVKQFYKSNENLQEMCKKFEKNYNIQLADSAMGIFHSLVLTFEHTGSVPNHIFYFEDNNQSLRKAVNPARNQQINVTINGEKQTTPPNSNNNNNQALSEVPVIKMEPLDLDDEFNDTDTELGEYQNDESYGNYPQQQSQNQQDFTLTPTIARITSNNVPEEDENSQDKKKSKISKKAFIGARFMSLDQVKNALETSHYLNFRSGTSLTTECMRRHNKKAAFLAPKTIKHSYGNWICKYEKKKPFVERECKAFVVASLSDCGQFLEIKKLVDHTIHH